ncbi:hypothetical protein JCM10450v2_005078 [Rhodotorula kratochvilovae]
MSGDVAGAMDRQELVDRLVTAVEEQDVLFCVYWLQEMGRRGMLDVERSAEGVNAPHSWKHHSALVTAVLEPHTLLRHFILVLLLLHVRHPPGHPAVEVARERHSVWAYELMRKWDVRRQHQEAPARHLLSLSPTEAAEWIDVNLPPHPNPDSLTGYGPLPPAPTRPSRSPSPRPAVEVIDLTSSPELEPKLQLAPPPPAASSPPAPASTTQRGGPRDPACQVRLCGADASVTRDSLKKLLVGFNALRGIEFVGDSAYILSFETKESAVTAMRGLQGRPGYRAAMLESVYRMANTPTRAEPNTPYLSPPPLPPPPAVPPPPPPATAAPPPGWAPPGASVYSVVVVHVGNLPVDTTVDELLALFAYAGVNAKFRRFTMRTGRKSGYVQVDTPADYRRAAAALHGSTMRSQLLNIERQPSTGGYPAGPVIILRGLPLCVGVSTVNGFARLTRVGAADEQMLDVGGGWGEGRFRAPSPDSAQECVELLDGEYVQGCCISAAVVPRRRVDPVRWRDVDAGARGAGRGGSRSDGVGERHGDCSARHASCGVAVVRQRPGDAGLGLPNLAARAARALAAALAAALGSPTERGHVAQHECEQRGGAGAGARRVG